MTLVSAGEPSLDSSFDTHELQDVVALARESRVFANKYQAIFDQASDAIVTILPDGKIDTLNHAAEDLTGYLHDEIVGEPVAMIIPDRAKNHIPERARPMSRELLMTPGTYEDCAILSKDGLVRLVDVSVRQVKSDGQNLTIALLRDVTEKKKMERELITKHTELRNAYFQLEKKNTELQAMQQTIVQAGKMAALGELAAGIAHELNQPLQGIRGYAQELDAILSVERTGEVTACLREIVSNVDKMASIIGYLRAFVRKSTESHELTSVKESIEEAFKMLSRQFAARGIEIHRQYAAEDLTVYANPLQLEQVFINLATNARDAIEVTSRGSGNIWVSTTKSKEFVEVVFKDDGCGMNERTKAKAFNPFFTTKEVGKGMGLGLSLSYGMISKLHGSIVVESELGKGAAFRIRIPRDFREMG